MKRLCRISVLFLSACLLAACDEGSKAPEKKVSEPPAVEQRATLTAAAKPLEPAPKPELGVPPVLPKTLVAQAPAKQVAKPEAPTKAKPAVANRKKPSVKPAAKASTASGKRKVSAPLDPALRKPLPNARLDLSLPKDLVRKMVPPGGEETHKPKPLLPQMFDEKNDSDFRLNGQLLYRDRELGVSRPLEGAELQFEFRQ